MNLSEKAQEVTSLLLGRKLTVALAESCTGGMIAAALVGCPGVSEALLEGCVCYSNEAKMRTLKVREETLKEYGAVSARCAEEMAEGIRNYTGSDCAIAVTGIAGPGGGTKEKPVGTVYIAVSLRGDVTVTHNLFAGDRQEIREQSAVKGLTMLIQKIEKQ